MGIGHFLSGIISDRIRSGEVKAPLKYERQPEEPDPKAVRGGKGRSLGKGATRKRNGGVGGAGNND